MDEQSFITYARKIGMKYPQLQEEIQDIYELSLSEIDEGESPVHEWEFAEGHINELIEDLQ